ncbi:MAG: methyltetrahydrofolate cobalamin methyltransferase [Deltaproteobacteria bacterium]|jgi:5-methyltetrahydrofolate--homocysteine methyltransferase|nr:methyltetrahydrofolate cobalamin methyltransferase [Deltaproteobacteria bacterium]
MIIVGELINASRKKIKEAIEGKKDPQYIKDIAVAQDKAGATYVDVNAGVFVGEEPEYLVWLVENVQSVVDKPLALDSPDPKAIEAAMKVHKGTPMLNSISMESDRWEKLSPVVANTDIKVVALCMSDAGMPTTASDRMKIAHDLVNGLTKINIPLDNIFIDPCVQPVGTDMTFGIEFLRAVAQTKAEFPGVHIMCGLSNISFGLPERKFLNRIFMGQAIYCGLDGAIIDPLDAGMMGTIAGAVALCGQDKGCRGYLKAFRAGLVKA